jgi:hypothetical protein
MVTVAEQVLLLLDASITVSVTVVEPRSAQVNAEGETLIERLPLAVQLSELPLFTEEVDSVPLPPALRETVADWQIAVGRMVSRTETVAVHVLLLEDASVTVRVTVVEPISEQVKAEGETLSPRLPDAVQLSELPLLTAAATSVAVPDPLRKTVTGWQTGEGSIVSETVTVAVQVLLFKEASVTVRVTELEPRFAQVKAEGETLRPRLPLAVQLSLLPLLTEEAESVPVPPALSETVAD